MDAPPPKPKSKESPEGLAEVERALSVLQGRHPETERLRREDEERRRERKAKEDAVTSVESRRVRSRRVRIGAGVSAALLVAIVVTVIFRNELARRSVLERATDPYRAMGFVVVESASRAPPVEIAADVPAGCLIATSTGSSRLKLVHPGDSVEGPAPLITCLCDQGHVTVTSDAKTEEGFALLRADANAVGGSQAFAFLPFKPGATGRGDQACSERSLDAWLDARRGAQGTTRPGDPTKLGPVAAVDGATSDAWLAREPSRAKLRDQGFVVTAMMRPNAPFTAVDVPANTCLIVVSENASDKPSIRLRGGALAVGPAAGVGWCTSAEAIVVAQRERTGSSGGEIAVLTVPTSRVGGLFGLREVAARSGLSIGATSVAANDFGWTAKSLLVASAIPEHLVSVANTPDLGTDSAGGAETEARIVALAVDKPHMIAADTPADVFSFCEPALDTATETVCVFSGAQKWRVQGSEALGGIARSKLPFWLFALQGLSEPLVLKLETQLLALARRLRRDGFEPTTIEAVTELDKGAEVLGRANEDAMVALALAPTPPWVMPYTDGPAWTIDEEPRIVPIRPLERVVVMSTTKTLPPKATRRTVVFRRTRR
jgi:hypothetical protein